MQRTNSNRNYRQRSFKSCRPVSPQTPEELERTQAVEAQKQADRKRDEFRAGAICVVVPVSTLAYCFLTGSWSSIVAAFFLFGIGLFFAVNIAEAYLASRSVIFPILALLVVTFILAQSFSATTTQTWHERVGAVAADGWASSATGRGATSHHGGVDHWLTVPHTRTLSTDGRWERVLNKFWYLLPIFGISTSLMAEHFVLGRRRNEALPQAA